MNQIIWENLDIKLNQNINNFFKNYNFKKKQKQITNDKCFYCFNSKNKLKNCDICFNSVCNNCSKRKYKKYIICDTCFYKVINKEFENEKLVFLKNKSKLIKQLEIKQEDINNLLEIKENEKKKLEKEYNKDWLFIKEEKKFLNEKFEIANSICYSNENKLNLLKSNKKDISCLKNYENNLIIINKDVNLKYIK